MAVFSGATTLGSVSFSSHLFDQQSCFLSCPLRLLPSSSSSSSSPSHRTPLLCIVKSFSSSTTADTDQSDNSDRSKTEVLRPSQTKNRNDAGISEHGVRFCHRFDISDSLCHFGSQRKYSKMKIAGENLCLVSRPSDWKIAKAYCKSGETFEGEVESFNGGGLLIRFHSLLGFLPYPQLSPSRSCKEPQKSIHEIAKTLVGSKLPVKVVQADEENRKLILSEKLALWPKYSQNVSVGDIFTGRVGSVEDYGAFIHLRFDDGLYHLTGLVHVSEVSWDYVQDVRDVLRDGDEVRVIVTNIDKEKSRITLSIKQLEDDPLLETLDKVILKDSSTGSPSLSSNNGDTIEPLPGLETILEELLKEDGIEAVKINRQGFEKRVVSQDLQLWLSNTPPSDGKFVLLARAGRQVQEIHLTTSLEQGGIKKALQHVLERVP